MNAGAGALVCLLLAAAVSSAQVQAGVRESGPSVEETLVLQLVNDVRADPAAAAARMAREQPPRPIRPGLDWDLFLEEMKTMPPAPPLVFNPDLLQAARNHARYIALGGAPGHEEEEGRPGFTGGDPAQRARREGYGGWSAECVVGRTKDPREVVFGIILDDGPGGPGGMQEGRRHRLAALNPGAREVGVALVPRPDGSFAATLLFGARDGTRLAGGVCYADLNGNGRYDGGEGVGGVRIAASAARATLSWPSGAWALAIEREKAVSLVAVRRGLRITARLPATEDNVGFDVFLLEPVGKELEQRLARLDRMPDASAAAARRLRIEILWRSEGVPLEAGLAERVAAAVGPLAGELSAARKRALEAVEFADAKEIAATLRAAAAPWQGTAAAGFFTEARRAAQARKAVDGVENAASRGVVRDRELARARDRLARALAKLEEPAWHHLLHVLDARLDTIARGIKR